MLGNLNPQVTSAAGQVVIFGHLFSFASFSISRVRPTLLVALTMLYVFTVLMGQLPSCCPVAPINTFWFWQTLQNGNLLSLFAKGYMPEGKKEKWEVKKMKNAENMKKKKGRDHFK